MGACLKTELGDLYMPLLKRSLSDQVDDQLISVVPMLLMSKVIAYSQHIWIVKLYLVQLELLFFDATMSY